MGNGGEGRLAQKTAEKIKFRKDEQCYKPCRLKRLLLLSICYHPWPSRHSAHES